jgi:hypothetical protein
MSDNWPLLKGKTPQRRSTSNQKDNAIDAVTHSIHPLSVAEDCGAFRRRPSAHFGESF